MSQAPLVNTSILEFQINHLIFNNITQIIIFTGSKHASQVDILIQKIKIHTTNMEIKLLKSEAASFGDMLREINSLKIIRGDFVLLSPETITNTELSKLIDQHLDVKSKSQTHIMTMSFKSLPNFHPLRTFDDENITIFEQSTHNLYRFQQISGKDSISLDGLELEKSLTQYELRYDLVDTGIYICTQALLNHFTENFDFHNLRKEFLKDFLSSQIIIDTIFVNILPPSDYCGKIMNYRTYGQVCKDILLK